MTVRSGLEPVAIHPTLRVGAATDVAERDANAIAEQVMSVSRASEPCSPAPDADRIRRSCTCGGSDVVRRAAAPLGPVGGVSHAGFPVTAAVGRWIERARGGGSVLPRNERSFFEPRFGADLSGVRIHADHEAGVLAATLGARAFTVDQHVFLGAGAASFGSGAGRHLLAHELAHTRRHRGRSMIRRWSLSGDTATSDAASDTLGGLAIRAGAKFDDWTCIRPISMRTGTLPSPPADFQTRYERYVQIGDTFDVSNLTATTGKTLRLYLFDDASEWKDAGIAKAFYPGSVSSLGPDGDLDAGSSDHTKSTPIHDFVVFGHAGGRRMWGGAGSFEPRLHSPTTPRPYFALAAIGSMPRRCWLTRTATARAVGCNSNTFATDFAATYLRTGSSVTATTSSVTPFCVGLPNQISALLGDPTGCAWYDQLGFTTSAAAGSPLVAGGGPFSTVAGFHGATHWSVTKGKL